MHTSIIIVGGGVIGCSIANSLSKHRQDIFLVEQFPKLGMATSSRNSGVIHSGIYYPKDSLKALHCTNGNQLTYEFCSRHNVPHRRTGKIVIATDDHELAELSALKLRGENNGVEGLEIIDRAGIYAREPHLKGIAALEVPSTGIVSAEDLVKTYARLAVDNGVNIVPRAKVISLELAGDMVRVGLRIGEPDNLQQETVEARCVINAAGLYADEVANMLGNSQWRIFPVRGEYCEIRGPRAELVRGLAYPLPHADSFSLGVHFTKTLWGTVLVGPSARYVQEKDDYEKDRLPVADFVRSAKTLLPEIEESDLKPGYSGLRPKLIPPGGTGFADFVITRDNDVPQVIHLVGIESPGLTAAPSIALRVSQLVSETLI